MISIKPLFSKAHFYNFLLLCQDCSPITINNLLHFVPYYCPTIVATLSMTTLNKTALPAINTFYWKPGVIKVNKDTFYPIINFKLNMTCRAFRFPRLSIDITGNTKGTSNCR